MLIRRIFGFLKHLDAVSLSVPVGILTASVILPLQPLIRQGLVAVLLIWFGIENMLGFPLWK